MTQIGWWANSGGRLAAGDVTMALRAINYRVPDNPPTTYAAYFPLYERRVNAFGSRHTGARTSPWQTGRFAS